MKDPAGIDVLTRDALFESKQNSEMLCADAASAAHLVKTFDNDRGHEIDGSLLISRLGRQRASR